MTRQLHDLAKRAAARFGIPSAWSVLTGRWPILDANGEPTMIVTKITLSPTGDDDASDGLLAFLALELGSVLICDGIALRLTEAGAMALSFPTRTSRRGTKHALLRPVNGAARAAIERTIFGALGIKQEAQR